MCKSEKMLKTTKKVVIKVQMIEKGQILQTSLIKLKNRGTFLREKSEQI